MKLVVFTEEYSEAPDHFRIGAIIDEESLADLTPSVLPLGLTSAEILRCYDLETGFLSPASEAVQRGNCERLISMRYLSRHRCRVRKSDL